MKTSFPQALKATLREEGGNDDDPRDHGGRTSRGITKSEYDAWRATHPGLPPDVWDAPQGTVEQIYHDQYWDPYCDKLPAGLDLMFFDFSVNAGRQQAVKSLQRALGVEADGMMGIVTWNAINAANIPQLITAYGDKRRSFYQSLRQYPIYGRGWMARTDRIVRLAQALASNTPAPKPIATTPEVAAQSKADPTDKQRPTVSVNTASTGTIISSVTGGVSDQLQSAGSALQPLSETFQWIKYICIALTIICAGLAIYAVIHNRRMAEA